MPNYNDLVYEWSEGNFALYDLLLTCKENGIQTLYSCGGHENRYLENLYITFSVNRELLSKLPNILFNLKELNDYRISYFINGDRVKCLNITGAYYIQDALFRAINMAIKSEIKANLVGEELSFYKTILELFINSSHKLINDRTNMTATLNYRSLEYELFQKIKMKYKGKIIPGSLFYNDYIREIINKMILENGLNLTWEELYMRYGTFQSSYDLESLTMGYNKI